MRLLCFDTLVMYAGVNSLDNTRGIGGQDGLGALTQLRTLSLPDNQIRRVDSLSGCIALQVVDMSQNYIDDLLPLTFALPSCLRALNISNNPVGNIISVLHLSSLTHLLHIFVSGCAFILVATNASIDLNPLFSAVFPELISVDNSNVSSVQRAQGKMLRNCLPLLGSMSNEQVIQYLASTLAKNSNAASFASASGVSATPFSDFDNFDENSGGLRLRNASAVVAQPLWSLSAPHIGPATALSPATLLPSAKSVEALAHNITRLKHKLASFASHVSAPPVLSQMPSPLPCLTVSTHPSTALDIQHATTVHFPSQAIAVSSTAAAREPFSSTDISHYSASVISRSWRSFHARQLFRSRHNEAAVVQKAQIVDPETNSDSLLMKRLELLEKTVAVQLQVIEKLHASIQNFSAIRDSAPVWRIVADVSAAATRIQSAWRGHVDREVAQVILEHKRYHNIAAVSRIACGNNAAAAAAAVTIAAFVRRKRAQDDSKWMLLAISSQCLYRLVCNMGDRLHSLEQRLMRLEGSIN
jgi:hypothetical protein